MSITEAHIRLPEWLRAKHSFAHLRATKEMLRGHRLHTVCEEARCPNKSECFSRPTATFMILGSRCSRNCGFCSVDSASPMIAPDPEEPMRVAEASAELGLKYVVVTSVTRDDLPDGGAGHFALTIRAIKERLPEAKVEVLTPDFKGDEAAISVVLEARPDVFNHNVETVPSLYSVVRPQASYQRSLDVLRAAKRIAPGVATKSGLMLGLGETMDEVVEVLRGLRDAGVDFVTIGQYLRPRRVNLPVHRYVEPAEFDAIGERARKMGFRFVASAPLVRSSMNAEEMYNSEDSGVRHV